MSKPRLCRWNCSRKTDRRCGICIYCCDERDQQFASGAPYVPPSERPGHRLYKGNKKQRSESQRLAVQKLNASKIESITKKLPATALSEGL
jgi:hypothetical protein